MNSQEKQMAFNALKNVFDSSPKPYDKNISLNIYSKYLVNNNDISEEQFEIWKKYLFDVLDILFSNLGLNSFMETNIKITQLIQQFNQNNRFNQNKITYMQLVFQIKDELIKLMQTVVHY